MLPKSLIAVVGAKFVFLITRPITPRGNRLACDDVSTCPAVKSVFGLMAICLLVAQPAVIKPACDRVS